MFPINLDLTRLSVALVGNGQATLNRLRQFDGDGAKYVTVYSEDPIPELTEQAGDRLQRYLPNSADVNAASIMFIIDLDLKKAAELASIAKAVGTIANVEDVKQYCDFSSPARIQRGDLMITVSTNGKSPRLAGRIRRAIENWLDPKWSERLSILADQREKWKADGADMKQLLEKTDDFIDRRGWLP
ncbi:MAG: siroheme synthase [Thalassospira sp.]|uniref:precorrin-2 dehydrogenase/sirohydrochlorin ferrochelatase family protein n=2 Tax=Thalassospira TaxID=168934 RepID=UPI000C5ED2B1|nr:MULTISPECIES: NAD(P)-dependent oxidoreductase [unclassified Thalassospira]MBE70874.1 siroheme synthase [Thalassospira sp.]MBO6802971.1 siroheme synthase [Thalassospira sp.]MBO6818182.1 siroheme synthase [Thalassospira sp.]MBO6887953.1 siroheme synthase [Thalassospira sp.]QPO12580.1 siroheme synthase [Thalassospira sp. A40-3]|tara:strand:- start:1572 stop:2132 length:561 start_codon:yes stop_codon:yes gene_type:complete